MNQISSNRFKKYGFDVYNFSRPQLYISDMPTSVVIAIKQKPKIISLQISTHDLYDNSNVKAQFPTFIDREFYNENPYNTLNDFISENIRLKDIIRETFSYYNNNLSSYKKMLYQNFDTELTSKIDCDIVNYRMNIIGRSVALCSNGDGIIFYNFNKKIKEKKITLKYTNISFKKLETLNRLVSLIKKNNIIPVIVLEPRTYNTIYDYDLKFITNELEINPKHVFDLTNFNISNQRSWADRIHFNSIGRRLYTDELIKLMKKNFTNLK